MVFMIKLPPAVSMAPTLETNRKDDRMSLVKTIHRPYGQLDNGQINGSNNHGLDSSEQYQNQLLYQGDSPTTPTKFSDDGCGTPKQKFFVACVFAVSACMVVCVFFLTAYGKVPASELDALKIDDVFEDAAYSSSSEVNVRTRCGYIIGSREEEGAYSFKGIPYAKPPIGELRWRKPVPLWIEESWCKQNQMHQATEFGSPCFQVNPYTKKFEGDEDCLYLNVWTPTTDPTSSGKHVMVFIHGGFLQFGSGHVSGLSPSSKLAKKLDMVFVSLNYRLYTMGFMALDMLNEDVLTDSKGNYGIWDQLCALQWVKDNIEKFGGDPKKVTIFGPDSGAATIMALMSSKKSQGLFRSAWLIGPTMMFNKSFPDVATHNKPLFLNRSGCGNPSCMRKMSAEEVVTAHLGKDDASFRIRDQNDLPIQGIFPEQLIVVDGELVKGTLVDCYKDTKTKSIPILLGTAAQAVDFWPGPDDLSSWPWSQYKKYVTTSLDSFSPQVRKMALGIYNGTAAQILNPNMTAEFLYTTMVSDIRQFCPINAMAKQIAEVSRSPLFRYTLTATPSKPTKIFNYRARYAFHMWDLIAFFDQIENFIDGPTQDDWQFRDLLHKTILTFVHSGGHDVADPEWLRFPKKIADLGFNVTFGDLTKTECKFWSESGLGIYAWVS